MAVNGYYFECITVCSYINHYIVIFKTVTRDSIFRHETLKLNPRTFASRQSFLYIHSIYTWIKIFFWYVWHGYLSIFLINFFWRQQKIHYFPSSVYQMRTSRTFLLRPIAARPRALLEPDTCLDSADKNRALSV